MGSHNFRILGVRKLSYSLIKKWKDLHHIKFNKRVSSFQGDQVKRLYKVDAAHRVSNLIFISCRGRFINYHNVCI